MAKYQELFDHLRLAILRGEYAPDDRLPSENALAIRYHVSRITTKHALNALAEADLIYRVQGKGSFVKPHLASRSRKLLLVLPFLDPQMGDYASGIKQELTGTTWELSTCTTQQLSQRQLEDYAGIFYYPQDLKAEMPTLIRCAQQHIPLVVLNDEPGQLALPSVASDNATGGALAVEHLKALGHTRIAFFSRVPFWEDWTGTVAARFFGYMNHYHQAGVDALKWAQALGNSLDVQTVAAFLHQEHITALIMGNDIEAVKLSAGLTKLGWHLPEDLSVVGFDDLPIAAKNNPPLTTLTQDFPAIGRHAVDLLLAQINNPSLSCATRDTVAVKLVERTSTTTKKE